MVKSYWIQKFSFPVPVGTPVADRCGNVMGKITKEEEGRILIELANPRPYQELEDWGVGFSQFEDTIET